MRRTLRVPPVFPLWLSPAGAMSRRTLPSKLPSKLLSLLALALLVALGVQFRPFRTLSSKLFPAKKGAALLGTASFRRAAPAAAPALAPPSGVPGRRAPHAGTAQTGTAQTGTAQADTLQKPAAGLARSSTTLPVHFHAEKRRAVLDALPPDGVAVFFSNPQRTRENDIRHPYRQDSNLYYLTGATEPASVLVLAPGGLRVDGERVDGERVDGERVDGERVDGERVDGERVDGETKRAVLFTPPRTQYSDAWLGPRLGVERAERVLGLPNVVSNERFADVLRQNAPNRQFFYLPLPYGIEEDSELADQIAAFRSAAHLMPQAATPLTRRAAEVMRTVKRPDAFQTFRLQFRERLTPEAFQSAFLRDAYRQFTGAPSLAEWARWRSAHFGPQRADGQRLERLLTQMREQKGAEEQRLLRRAASLTTQAQRKALRAIAPGTKAYEIEALADYVFKKNGAEAAAFPSVVGGAEASVRSYHDNRDTLKAGRLVVTHFGAEYHGYAADVARTAPVDGTFSDEQRALYELVLKAQQAALRAARVGNNFRDPHQVARRLLGEGLVRLGIIDEADGVDRYLTHASTHYLGLYAHDVGRGGPLKAGTVLSVGAGLSLRPSKDLPEKWRGLAVRLTDDVLVTSDGPVNLSKAAPREPDAVEALMKQKRAAPLHDRR